MRFFINDHETLKARFKSILSFPKTTDIKQCAQHFQECSRLLVFQYLKVDVTQLSVYGTDARG